MYKMVVIFYVIKLHQIYPYKWRHISLWELAACNTQRRKNLKNNPMTLQLKRCTQQWWMPITSITLDRRLIIFDRLRLGGRYWRNFSVAVCLTFVSITAVDFGKLTCQTFIAEVILSYLQIHCDYLEIWHQELKSDGTWSYIEFE